MRRVGVILLISFSIMGLFSCTPKGPSVDELVQTKMLQTRQAASPTPLPTKAPTVTTTATPTPIPTDTSTASPTPTPIPTSTATPTITSTPTETLTPTPPPTPTDTSTPTATPGPLTFHDDFSQKIAGAWSDCKGCEWKDGKLYMGPYEPSGDSDQYHYIICEACGKAKFYRVSVDATFVSGYADRLFGLMTTFTDDGSFMEMGISTFQFCFIGYHNHVTGEWFLWNPVVKQILNKMVNPGYLTNHLEVIAKPSQGGGSDYYINLNGRTSFLIYSKPAVNAKVGLILDFHNISIAYDNFEYEEIEAP